MGRRRYEAYDAHRDEDSEDEPAAPDPRAGLERAFRFHHQPAGAEQRIAGDDAEAGGEGERRQPIEGAAGEGVALDLDPGDEAAKHGALHEGGDGRADAKGEIPRPRVLGLETQL